jgi:hypothetical protein
MSALVMKNPSTASSSRTRPAKPSQASSAICLRRAKIPALIHSSRRARVVVAEHCEFVQAITAV